MTYFEILGLIVSGAGTLASVLGIFFAIYAKHNGRLTREFIATQNKEIREFVAAQNKEMQKLTAELVMKLDERADGRHREIMDALKR